MKKFIAALLVVMTVGSLLFAGGAAEEATTGAIPERDVNTPLYPIEGTPKFTYWTPINSNCTKYISSYNENEAYQEIQRRTGVELQFIHPVAGQEKVQFNLIMASGELPDIMQEASLYEGGEEQGFRDGAFVDLTPYLPTYAPDYWKLLQDDPELKRECMTEDGRIIAFYKVASSPVPPWCRAIARADWLEEFGMEAPMTIEEYEAYFDAILANKPGVVPFMLPQQHSSADHNLVEIFYGAFDIFPDFYVKDGTIHHGKGDAELLEYLKLMNRWYKKGYISKDFPALETKQVWALFDSGRIGMYIDTVDGARQRTIKAGVPMTGCPYPRENKDSGYHTALATWPKNGNVTCITTACKNIPAAVAFLNYGYSEEGSMLYNYGIEGKMYNMVDGVPKYTDYVLNNPVFGPEASNYILRIHFAPKKLVGTPLIFNPSLAKDEAAVENRLRFTDDPTVDSSYRLPPIKLTAEELAERAPIMTNVKTYADEMILKFIIGSESLDNFDKYIAQLNKYGLDRAIEITQDAYDRYVGK